MSTRFELFIKVGTFFQSLLYEGRHLLLVFSSAVCYVFLDGDAHPFSEVCDEPSFKRQCALTVGCFCCTCVEGRLFAYKSTMPPLPNARAAQRSLQFRAFLPWCRTFMNSGVLFMTVDVVFFNLRFTDTDHEPGFPTSTSTVRSHVSV